MTKQFKLVISDRIEFDVKWSMNDGGEQKPFGMRLTARRQALDGQERDFHEQVKVQEFLDARGVAMLSWIGKPALTSEGDEPVPAGKEALDALYELVGGMVHLVFTGYLAANSARGKSGN